VTLSIATGRLVPGPDRALMVVELDWPRMGEVLLHAAGRMVVETVGSRLAPSHGAGPAMPGSGKIRHTE
jgi:hypothetical protein